MALTSPAARTSICPTTYCGGNSSDPQYCVGCPSTFTVPHHPLFIFLGFSSNYQSLQAALTKRMSHGVAFNSAITWAKGMGYIGGDDGGLSFFAGSWRRNYAPTDFDRTVNFAQSFTYRLPFGRGQKHLSTGFGAQVLGGWKSGWNIPGRHRHTLHRVHQRVRPEYARHHPDGKLDRSLQCVACNRVGSSLVQSSGLQHSSGMHGIAPLPEPRMRQHGTQPVPRAWIHLRTTSRCSRASACGVKPHSKPESRPSNSAIRRSSVTKLRQLLLNTAHHAAPATTSARSPVR